MILLLSYIQYITLLCFESLTLFLYIYYSLENTKGYFWKAIIKNWVILSITIILYFVIGICIYEFSIQKILPVVSIVQKVAVGALAGFTVILVPNGAVNLIFTALYGVVLKNVASRNTKDNNIIRRIAIFSSFTKRIGETIAELKEIDIDDAISQLGWWNVGISNNPHQATLEVKNRIRYLYEDHKLKIANKNKLSSLAQPYIDSLVAPKFYSLTSYL